ncbi:MAG TPA: DUF5320 domain-containing protein [Methanoregulaceae archaeon]|nr:DUF5320 domain-containing protein [Methanoregulaceae archaeon]HQJ87629.1 DUF5320 domain-containing protein [Methanoregulaceae archaeon]
MPGFDMTGPAGYGPGTGRGMGPCGRGMAMRRGGRGGFGRGAGMGFGRGALWMSPAAEPLTDEAKRRLLEAELARIEAEKIEIQRRLNDLA